MRGRAAFETLVDAALHDFSPAEQRVAQFFTDRKEIVLLSSAAEIGERVGSRT